MITQKILDQLSEDQKKKMNRLKLVNSSLGNNYWIDFYPNNDPEKPTYPSNRDIEIIAKLPDGEVIGCEGRNPRLRFSHP